MIEIVQYVEEHEPIWDDFVLSASGNGTVFHTRRFLTYHAARKFNDHSILIFQSKKLVAVVAAALRENGEYFSHPGTSCGGPVIHRDHFKIADILKITEAIEDRFQNRLGMRLCEDFLVSRSNAPLLYHFANRCDVRFELSAHKPLTDLELVDSIPRASTRSAVRKIFREHNRFEVADSAENYLEFYTLLEKNLRKHEAKPTHSREELLRLRQLLGKDQSLILWRDQESTVRAGVWMIRASRKAWHAQYIGKHEQCALNGVVEATIIEAMRLALKSGAECFSLGISTEDAGARLNVGLITFKEKLGCEFGNRYILTPHK